MPCRLRLSVREAMVLAFASALLTGCSSTLTERYVAAGAQPLCRPDAARLGRVVVVPEAAWRENQKDVAERVEMAQRAVDSVFRTLPCGQPLEQGGIRGFARWADRPEAELLGQLRSEGADTAILLRLEELTPRIHVTLSLPFLWSGTSEADVRVRALDTQTGGVLVDLRVRRSTGGPFQLRPAGWAEAELEAALREIVGGPAD